MKVKKNDTVMVITGAYKGKTGKVVESDPKGSTIKVEGINVQKRATKPKNAQDVGGFRDKLGAIDASNVMVVCPECGKTTRVGHTVVDGKKVRVCKKCNAVIDKTKEAKEVKKATRRKRKAAEAE